MEVLENLLSSGALDSIDYSSNTFKGNDVRMEVDVPEDQII